MIFQVVKNRQGKLFAAKYIKFPYNMKQYIKKEISIITSIKHKNILSPDDCFIIQTPGRLDG